MWNWHIFHPTHHLNMQNVWNVYFKCSKLWSANIARWECFKSVEAHRLISAVSSCELIMFHSTQYTPLLNPKARSEPAFECSPIGPPLAKQVLCWHYVSFGFSLPRPLEGLKYELKAALAVGCFPRFINLTRGMNTCDALRRAISIEGWGPFVVAYFQAFSMGNHFGSPNLR